MPHSPMDHGHEDSENGRRHFGSWQNHEFSEFLQKKHSFFSWKQSPKKSSEPLAMLAMLALLVSTDWMANICRKVTKRYHSVCMDSMYQCCEPDDPELQHHH